jgi:hypothetical protein
MDKRYQVFVSSTFRDLERERQEVMHALLELDCMPAGMELFPAANETQWSLIQKVIDDCDYYILILAGRYGSTGNDGVGYTEKEYRYALKIGKPTIAFLHRDPGKIIAENSESTAEGKAKLEAFRSSVEKKLCKHWDTPQELGSVVSRSLIQLIKSTPAVGWVRGSELPDRDATIELLQLRRKVEELEGELSRSRTSAPKGAEALAQGDARHTINISASATPPGEFSSRSFGSSFDPTWDEIFAVVAPLMIHEASEASIHEALDKFAWQRTIGFLRKEPKLARHKFSAVRVNSDDFQTVKVQLRALGLIAKNVKTRSVKDTGTYWTLTPYGDEVMTRLRAIRRSDEVANPEGVAEPI